MSGQAALLATAPYAGAFLDPLIDSRAWHTLSTGSTCSATLPPTLACLTPPPALSWSAFRKRPPTTFARPFPKESASRSAPRSGTRLLPRGPGRSVHTEPPCLRSPSLRCGPAAPAPLRNPGAYLATQRSSARRPTSWSRELPFTHKSCRNAVAYRNRWSGPA